MCFNNIWLQCLGSSFTWNLALDYSCVVCTQVVICPHRHILVLFDQVLKSLSLLRCAICIETNYLQIMIDSQVALFIRSGGPMGSVVFYLFTEVL